MFCPEKNSFLQLVCAMEPRVINKVVETAMSKKLLTPSCAAKLLAPIECTCTEAYYNVPPRAKFLTCRLASTQPSTFATQVDVTRARLGFGRIGLRILIRQLHSDDVLTQLQAVHTVMDQVQISENALYLINQNVIHRLTSLLDLRDPVVREKVCVTLRHLARYHQGRQRLGKCPNLIYRIMCLIMEDKPEIRYAAAKMLTSLSRDRGACEDICKVDDIIENLLHIIKNELSGIVLFHLRTLENLFEWDPVVPLKKNAFQIILKLFSVDDTCIVEAAMDCMTQLCKHDIGKLLADENDLTFVLLPFLEHDNYDVVTAATGLMCYTTLTKRSKWRAKEACRFLTYNLICLCHAPTRPPLQLRAMQVLINLCDCPDIRHVMAVYWLKKTQLIMIRDHEEWDGTRETTSMGLETGHNYRTMCIEGVETIKNDYGDNAQVINVHGYLREVNEKKRQLIRAILKKPYP